MTTTGKAYCWSLISCINDTTRKTYGWTTISGINETTGNRMVETLLSRINDPTGKTYGWSLISDTVNSLISGHHRCKKFCPLIGGVRLLESFFLLVSNGFLVMF